jgi:hypothetical protein
MTVAALTDEVIVLNFPPTQAVTGSVTVTGITFSGSINPISPPAAAHTTTNFVASLASQVAMATNASRRGASFFNVQTSTGVCYVSIGAVASTGSYVVAVRPGAYYSFDTVPAEAISFIFDRVPGNVMVTEQS